MRSLTLMLAMLVIVTGAASVAPDTAEARWRPTKHRFIGCPRGKWLNVVGRCISYT